MFSLQKLTQYNEDIMMTPLWPCYIIIQFLLCPWRAETSPKNQSNPPDGHMTSSHISRPQSPSILMLPVITIATLALRPFSRPFRVAFLKILLFCRISIAVNCQCIIVWSFCVLNHVDQKVFYKIHLCKHEHFSADLMFNNCW